MKVRGIRGDRLTCCRTGQQSQEDTQITRAGNQLLNPHTGDVQFV